MPADVTHDAPDEAQAARSAYAAYNDGRLEESARLWADVRARFPGNADSYTAAARALRDLRRHDEAEALLAAAVARFPGQSSPLTEHAWLALLRRDMPAAIERWAHVRALHPHLPDGWVQGARALAGAWRHAEAEEVLAEGMRRLPDEREVAREHAFLAYHQSRLPEAEARFAALLARFPDDAEGARGAALALRAQSRFAEADAALARGMEAAPGHAGLALEHAALPVFPVRKEDKDWHETLRRMERVRARFPAFEPGWVQGVRLLAEAGLAEAAELLAAAGAERLPGCAELALAWARAAQLREDWPEAARRFADIAARLPGDPAAEAGLAGALARSGRLEEAEAALRAVLARAPDSKEAQAEFAELAGRRDDWAEAVRRWEAAAARFSDDASFAHRLYAARMRLTEAAPGADLAAFLAPAARPDPGGVAPDVTDLVMQFESLGGRELGCEFGIFQRDCGAEPLGLLRWADMPYEGVVSALESRFEGVGSEEHTELFVTAVGGGRGEYCTRDRRGMMFTRTFVYEDEAPFERMRAAQCRRLQFLARKLVDDLSQGTKIFVFRLTNRNLAGPELDRLHAAVRSYGDNTLLYVRYADAAHPNGTVERARPGLMIGYIDRFKMTPDRRLSASPPTASWIAICRAAYALWRAAPQQEAA